MGAWLGILAFTADVAVETIDVLVENRSRQNLGGLSTGEYAFHINATGLRLASAALILAAKPALAWSFSSPIMIEPVHPAWLSWMGLLVAIASLIGGVQHLWLMRQAPMSAHLA